MGRADKTLGNWVFLAITLGPWVLYLAPWSFLVGLLGGASIAVGVVKVAGDPNTWPLP